MTREAWRRWWRADRIIRRETAKASRDMLLYGTGFTRKGDFGEWKRDGSDVMQRVDPREVFLA